MKYYESQSMVRDQPFIIPVISIITIISWIIFVQQALCGIPMGNNPAPDWAVWLIWIIFGILFPPVFVILRLEIRVDDEKLEFRFFPITILWRKIPFDKIEKAESTEFQPVRDFGGWGIRFGSRGKAYTISGNTGVMIKMKDGRTFILGSKHATELEQAINRS